MTYNQLSRDIRSRLKKPMTRRQLERGAMIYRNLIKNLTSVPVVNIPEGLSLKLAELVAATYLIESVLNIQKE